jgi:Ti-type conjugative transfer relaxase TraA
VLSIGKLVDVDYYLDRTAVDGIDAYYSLGKEAPGRWLGEGAATLGLAGQVDGADLKAVLEGVAPGTGFPLGLAPNRRVKGFDLCFRAPKSVSVLAGLGDPDAEREIHACHERAVTAALDYLERNATWTRRGRNGAEVIAGSGLVGAGFRHRSSRAGDPHLHTHVLVPNMARGADGRWSALDARLLYEHAKTAGCLYEAQLRAELNASGGLEWGPVCNGIADARGVPPALLAGFSKRRVEIEARLAERGLHSPRAAEIATLDTRRRKPHAAEAAGLRERWRAEASGYGFDVAAYRAVFGRVTGTGLTVEREEQLAVELAAPTGLTRRVSVFDRRAVLQALCERLPDGAPVTMVEDVAVRYLARPEVVDLGGRRRAPLRRADGKVVPAGPFGEAYSTTEMLAVEERLIAAAVRRRAQSCALVSSEDLDAALAARPSLSAEQVRLVVGVTTSGNGVDVVAAAAGTGKTFSLDAARDAWQRAGYRVIGAALAARAAAELESGAGIPSVTVARLLGDLDRPGSTGLDAGTVLVVDEAAMIGSRTLERLLAHAATAGAKVVLVGDARQLPEMDAGGAFAGLARRLGPFTLKRNRRQAEEWERAALASLRAGKVDAALDAYSQHGRVVTGPTAEHTRETLVADWWAARTAGETVLMLAARRADVDDLNGRARARMSLAGHLAGPTIMINERPFQAGDRVMCLRNNYRIRVRNGTVGTIGAVDAAARAVIVTTDHGAQVVLPSAYLDAGHLTHAYASTVHKAQGTTVDRALLLGNDDLYLELGYVGLSRGRATNHLYVVGGAEHDDDTERGIRHDPSDPRDEMARALHDSRAKTLAIEHRDQRAPTLTELFAQRNELRRLLASAGPDPAADLEALRSRRGQTAEQVRERHEHLAQRERKTPRYRRRRDSDLEYARVELIRATWRLERVDEQLQAAIDRSAERAAFLDAHPDLPARLDQVERAIDAGLSRRLAEIGRNPPEYLTDTLGAIPSAAKDRTLWWSTARTVETYRARYGVTDPSPLGRTSGAPERLPDWIEAYGQLQRASRDLHGQLPTIVAVEPEVLDLGL